MGRMFLVVVDSHTKWLVSDAEHNEPKHSWETDVLCRHSWCARLYCEWQRPDVYKWRVPWIHLYQWNAAYIRCTLSSADEWLSGESGSVIHGSHETHSTCTIAVVFGAMACKLSADPALNHESLFCWRRPMSRLEWFARTQDL